jgi:hypothetical protein
MVPVTTRVVRMIYEIYGNRLQMLECLNASELELLPFGRCQQAAPLIHLSSNSLMMELIAGL